MRRVHKKVFLLLAPLFLFSIYRMSLSELLYIRSVEIVNQEEQPMPLFAKEFLAESLTFLGMGSQSIAFTSENSPYVCKICKANRYQVPLLLEKLFPSFALSRHKAKADKKNRDFFSYDAAYQHLQEQTGVVFLHLQKTTNLDSVIHLIDPLHLAHSLPSNSLSFYIQKKASSLSSYLDACTKKNDTVSLQNFFEQLFFLAYQGCMKGFWIKDTSLKNMGVCDGKPIWIDPGRVIFDLSLKNKTVAENTLQILGSELQDALSNKYPSLVPLVEESLLSALKKIT